MKRRFLASLLAAGSLCATGVVPSYAQEYPSRPIRLILGHAPGGGADQVARALARPLDLHPIRRAT